ncbi:ParB/RepB/Spo0J family partition protein [Roseobacter sp. S98]|uniref:ParB/RepB/Spo0J family partition protein n=1 Tax=Roseobacter algicola (ex Choi et al. 2025) (nom. illeg.) TaxID=3092138 RepID=UPI0035C752A0
MTREARLLETAEIPITDIDIDDRLRPVSELAVQSLVASIREIGLQAEIHVRKVRHQGGRLKLIAGGHRVAAFRALGHDTIPAKVWDCTDDWATMAEIDDNLAHADLNPLDLAVFLAERKAVYERMYPEAKNGGNRGNQHVGGRQNDIMSFCQTVAEKRDITARHVERLVAAGQGLNRDLIAQLRKAPKPVTLADLQMIAKCPPDDRPVICRELSLGKAKSAKEVLDRRNKAPGAAAKSPDAATEKLDDAWNRSSKATRLQFVSRHVEELEQLLAQASRPGGQSGDVVSFKARTRS